MDNKNICLRLLKAETEEEVISILRELKYWDDLSAWQHYGDMENNWGIIGNQQSKPESALVEKLVNSVDAVIMRESQLCNVIPNSKTAPKTISEAVEMFFQVKNGNLALISSKRRTELSKEIGLVATGSRSKPNYIIFDRGEGQEPNDFPDTFLSLNKSNKLRIPYVQGTFNQGGTGVIRFCGENRIQVIVSRRHPKLSKNKTNNWGFTVIKRQDPSNGMKHSVFTYLAPKNNILCFTSKSIEIPCGSNGTQEIEPIEWGTIIKLYEYNMPGGLKTNIKLDLYYKISLLLPRVGLPIRFYERRGYESHSSEATMAGLSVRLDDDIKDNLEEDFHTSSFFYVEGQKYNYSIYVFKEGCSSKYRKNEGVIFSYNGQAHGFLSTSFFERKTINLGYISDSILVMVDCSEISQKTREDLLMNSRDRLTEGTLSNEIESELIEILKTHEGLKNLNHKRREKLVNKKLEDSRPLKEVLDIIIKKSPSLEALFKNGGDFSNPFGFTSGNEAQNFCGTQFPTYFRLLKGQESRECHLGQRFRVQFESDVVDDYFYREEYPGTLHLEINEVINKSYRLNSWKGIQNLNIIIPEGIIAGDILKCKVEVTDDTQIDPFVCEFKRYVHDPINIGGGKPGRRKKSAEKGEGDENTQNGLSLPRVVEVYKDGWEQHDFDEFSALNVITADEKGYDYFINMDNKYLLYEIKRKHLESDSPLIKAKYKFAIVLIGMALLKDKDILENNLQKNHENHYDEYISNEMGFKYIIRFVTKSFAAVAIPMIDSLSDLNIEEITYGE